MDSRIHSSLLPKWTNAPVADASIAPTSSTLPEERRAEWGSVFDRAPAATAMLNLQGHYLYVNQAFCRLLGHISATLVPRTLIENALAQGHATAEVHCTRNDGNTLRIHLSCSVTNYSADPLPYILLQAEDITTRDATWQECFTNAPVGMALLDLDGRWTSVNDALCDLLGYGRDELLAMHCFDLVHPADLRQDGTSLADGRPNTSVEMRYRHRAGHPVRVSVRTSVVTNPDGTPSHLIGHYEPIGDGRMSEAHMYHLALHDPLTGLANRTLLADRVDRHLAALNHGTGVLAVLVADLDELKQINDRYGHRAGDDLLTAAAHQLSSSSPSGATVARLGGDEFVVAALVDDAHAAEALRDHVAQHLNTRIIAAGHPVELKASVGLAATRDPTTSQEELLHQADQDMYARKTQSRAVPARRP